MDYVPELTSELEREYIELKHLNFKLLNVYGPSGCGKTTIVKTYLKNINYNYIDDYNQSYDTFVTFLKKLTRINVMSYFINDMSNSIIVIDNYDDYYFSYKDYSKYLENFKVIIISRIKYFKNFLYISPPSDEYLSMLILLINKFYDKRCNKVNTNGSFIQFFTSINSNYYEDFDNFNTDLESLSLIYETKDLNITSYDINDIHYSYLYNVNNLDTLNKCADNISTSIQFVGTDYYHVINNIIIYSLDSKIECINKFKLNYHRRNNIIRECKNFSVTPNELNLVKKIKNKVDNK